MIYVTGAAGFIGSHLVDKLKSTEGVICCDIRDKEMLQPQDLIQKFREIEPESSVFSDCNTTFSPDSSVTSTRID